MTNPDRINVGPYRGYRGTATKVKSEITQIVKYVGRIDHIRDAVTFQCYESETVREEFERAVDEYLHDCQEANIEPEASRC